MAAEAAGAPCCQGSAVVLRCQCLTPRVDPRALVLTEMRWSCRHCFEYSVSLALLAGRHVRADTEFSHEPCEVTAVVSTHRQYWARRLRKGLRWHPVVAVSFIYRVPESRTCPFSESCIQIHHNCIQFLADSAASPGDFCWG